MIINEPIVLDAILIQDDETEGWTALAIDIDVAAQNDTFTGAIQRICEALCFEIDYHLSEGKQPLSMIKPAPQEYRDEFNELKAKDQGVLAFTTPVPIRFSSEGYVHQDLDTNVEFALTDYITSFSFVVRHSAKVKQHIKAAQYRTIEAARKSASDKVREIDKTLGTDDTN